MSANTFLQAAFFSTVWAKSAKEVKKKERRTTYRQSKGLWLPVCRHGHHSRRTEQSIEDGDRKEDELERHLSVKFDQRESAGGAFKDHGGNTTRSWWMKTTQEKGGMNSKQKCGMTLQRSHYAEIEMPLQKHEEWGSYWTKQFTGRSVEEFGKNWSEFSDGSIEQDHGCGEHMAKKHNIDTHLQE